MDGTSFRSAVTIKRVVIGAVSLLGAIHVGVYSRAAVAAQNMPDRALSIRPHDGIALTAKFTREMEENPQFAPSVSDARAVAASLRMRPLSEGALRILGSSFEIAGKDRRALAAMSLANRVSRHDLLNQMWLIENAVQKEDIPSAVAHYHNALSVKEGAGAILYPVLANALAFPEVRNALRPYVAKPARWIPAFLSVASTKADAGALKSLILPVASKLNGEAYTSTSANLLYRLVLADDVMGASNLAARMVPGFKPATFSDLRMSSQTTDPRLGLLGWSLPQTDSVSSILDEGGFLSVNVSPLARAVAAERDIIVVPGQTYNISQLVTSDTSGGRAESNLNVGCVSGAKLTPVLSQQILGRLADPASSSQFSVPANCRLLRVSIAVRGPEGQVPSTMKISKLTLTRR